MNEMDDMQLLREYAMSGSEPAFATLVTRHLRLVWSVAWRHASESRSAEEITQAVFVILARKAATLRPGTILSGWLFHTTQLTAAHFIRDPAWHSHPATAVPADAGAEETESSVWQRMSPLLDEAIAGLDETARNAVVLRFIEGKDFKAVGVALGLRKDGVRAQTNRAVAKMRRFFRQHGVSFSATIMAGALAASAAQAVPPNLAPAVVAAAIAKAAPVPTSTINLIKATWQSMPWTSQISRPEAIGELQTC
jgi:RNA polymerase sigma factor (sigma-70 family)